MKTDILGARVYAQVMRAVIDVITIMISHGAPASKFSALACVRWLDSHDFPRPAEEDL